MFPPLNRTSPDVPRQSLLRAVHLVGPRIVDVADFNTNNQEITLFSPQLGDLILGFVSDPAIIVPWNEDGLLSIVTSTDGSIGVDSVPAGLLGLFQLTYASDGNPLKLVLGNNGTPSTLGHIELYMLIARMW